MKLNGPAPAGIMPQTVATANPPITYIVTTVHTIAPTAASRRQEVKAFAATGHMLYEMDRSADNLTFTRFFTDKATAEIGQLKLKS